MNAIAAFIPALPFLGALLLITGGRHYSATLVRLIGGGSIAAAAIITCMLGWSFLQNPAQIVTVQLWNWISSGNLQAGLTLRLDSLSIIFTFVITFVGTLIHIYATEYMEGDEDYARFFACMNLFVCAMLLLVLADNLLLLYLGWEGVGLCSYLLIGFWYKDPANGYAARKAFIVTRIGDTAMAVALFMLFQYLGTVNIADILTQAPTHWTTGQTTITIITLMLLGGAVGKSAQLPLQTWLPDAMAGPTPVSALIHAATMVTAGVYLIARMHVLFELSPVTMLLVASIGVITLLLAGCSALVQTDIKKVLAYSTISQIGYMFLALGVGAWSAAVFHFFTHAFFKALLFLGAGAVILAMHHEQDMFKMGGLRKQLPGVYRVFLAGAAALAAVPYITSGFYSKDAILWLAWQGPHANTLLWLGALLGALLTALYTFRMVFVTFWGDAQHPISHYPKAAISVPLSILAVLAIVAGFIELPHNMGHIPLFSDFVQNTLPATAATHASAAMEWTAQLLSAVCCIAGIALAYLLYVKHAPALVNFTQTPFAQYFTNLWKKGWAFDDLYDLLIVKPFTALAHLLQKDWLDKIYLLMGGITIKAHHILASTQKGLLRWYVMGLLIGVVLMLTAIVMHLT